MRIEIEIPKEFEEHFKQDKFEDTLHRLSADAHLIAGNYEQETAIMLIKAFADSKPAYDLEAVVAELEEMKSLLEDAVAYEKRCGSIEDRLRAESSLKDFNKVIEIVIKGGVK